MPLPDPVSSRPDASGEIATASPRGRLGCAGATVAVTLILALLAGGIFFELERLPLRLFEAGSAKLEQYADKVRGAFVALTGVQPTVKINERVVYEQSAPVLELAVVERQFEVERDTEDTWLGSTKRLKVRGNFRVKAGFDLTKPFSVQIGGASLPVATVQMPAPQVLTVEQIQVEVLTQENGLWNHMQPTEYAQAVNDLNTEARSKAVQAGMIKEARRKFEDQLAQKLGPEIKLRLLFGAAGETTPTPRPRD